MRRHGGSRTARTIAELPPPQTRLEKIHDQIVVIILRIGPKPNVPPARLKTLREALERTFKDPELLAHSEKVKLPISFTSGDETKAMFVNALNQTPDVVKLVKELSQTEK